MSGIAKPHSQTYEEHTHTHTHTHEGTQTQDTQTHETYTHIRRHRHIERHKRHGHTATEPYTYTRHSNLELPAEEHANLETLQAAGYPRRVTSSEAEALRS